MIKYLGSKRTLIPLLMEVFQNILPESGTILDLFSGTSRVGHAAKRAGFRVLASDHNAYAHALSTCYVQADSDDVLADVTQLCEEFNKLPGTAGYFTETFCEHARFFQPKNGARIDAIREAIEHKNLGAELRAVMLVSLMEAADRVDSTTGVQMAYLKQWATRAHNDLCLRPPAVLPRAFSGKGQAFQLDALEAARLFADVAYLDPPYNQHSYLGNYHVWESLILWDKPAVFGVARKRVDVRERPSAFNRKRNFRDAFTAMLAAVQAPHLVLSFSNEGIISPDECRAMLQSRGEVAVIDVDFKRYVGAQIGIHNRRGERVGEVSHLRNREHVFVVSPNKDVMARIEALFTRLSAERVQKAAFKQLAGEFGQVTSRKLASKPIAEPSTIPL